MFRPIFLGLSLFLAGGYFATVATDTVVSAQTLQLRGVLNTPEGIVLLINGNPQIVSERAVSPDRLIIDLMGTVVAPNLHNTVFPINRYGVRQIRVAQNQKNPAITRIVLDFDGSSDTSSIDWEAIFIDNRVLVRPVQTASQPEPSDTGFALIERLILSPSGQLLIQTNQPFTHLSTEDKTNGTYNITINNARISPQLERPQLDGSALDGIRMSQVGSSVIIGLRPSAGWRIRENNRSNSQQIYVQLFQPQAQNLGQTPNQVPGYLDPNLPITDPPSPNLRPPRTGAVPSPRVPRGRGVVLVDPGHGGRDVGAVGNGIFESNVVLAISLRLGRILEGMGYTVVYTRTDNTEVELQPRVDLGQRVGADVFISVHANSLESRLSSVSGVETFYAPGATVSGRLATLVQNQIIAMTGARNRGVKTARFHVIRRSSMPAILIETGFVTNPQESANLNNPTYQETMAQAIARGVDQFLRSR